jgi:hypothetical protein
MEAETSVVLQEIMLEILLKHLERVVGIKWAKKSDESTDKKTEETSIQFTKRPEEVNTDEVV